MGELIARQRLKMQELRQQWPAEFKDVRKRWRGLRRAIDRGREQELTEEALEEDLNASGIQPAARRWRGGPFALLRRRKQGPR